MTRKSTTMHTAKPGALCYYNSMRGPVLCRIVGTPTTVAWTLRVDKASGAYDAGMIIPTTDVWAIPYRALTRDGIHIRTYRWEYEA